MLSQLYAVLRRLQVRNVPRRVRGRAFPRDLCLLMLRSFTITLFDSYNASTTKTRNVGPRAKRSFDIRRVLLRPVRNANDMLIDHEDVAR